MYIFSEKITVFRSNPMFSDQIQIPPDKNPEITRPNPKSTYSDSTPTLRTKYDCPESEKLPRHRREADHPPPHPPDAQFTEFHQKSANFNQNAHEIEQKPSVFNRNSRFPTKSHAFRLSFPCHSIHEITQEFVQTPKIYLV